MKRYIERSNESKWCQLEITLEEGRLSVCGSSGYIVSQSEAKREARQSWVNYYDEVDDGERWRLMQKFGCKNAAEFARTVARVDGPLHGVDIHAVRDDRVFVTTGCGQIVDELREWFPEAAPLLPWHLNDMRAGCEHQEREVEAGRAQYEISEPCETCGYQYGHEWRKRQLPVYIVELAKTVCADEE